jgi:hypothetical protein
MRRRSRSVAGVLGATLIALLAFSASAGASYHDMRIRAVFKAGNGSNQAFVQLQMLSAGQNLVNGAKIKLFNADATISSSYTIGSNVGNSESQRMVLVGAASVLPTPDSTQNFQSDFDAFAPAGAVCYIGVLNEPIDCFSWGTFTGEALLPSPAGTPQTGALSSTAVRVRNITSGCATALDAPDDTNSSSADFSYVMGYSIRNNASPITETLCPPPVIPAIVPSAGTPGKKTRTRRCKKKPSKNSASAAKKKKCKRKKRH